MKRLFLIMFMCILLVQTLYSQERMRIAVMDLKEERVSSSTAKIVSNMIRTELINTDRFIVIERNQMESILREQGLQQAGCTDQACAVQMGKLLSARKIMVGEVSSLGKSIIMTVRIVDVEKGVSEFAAKEKAATEDDLDSAVGRMTQKLTAQIARVEPAREARRKTPEGPVVPEQKTVSGYYLRGIVPGWGQFYADRPLWGYVYSGAFVATGAFFGYSYWSYLHTKHKYDNLSAGTSRSTFNSKYDDYHNAGILAYVALGIWAAVYTANWVDILFISRPNFTPNATALGTDRVFVSLDSTRLRWSETERMTESYFLGLGMRF